MRAYHFCRVVDGAPVQSGGLPALGVGETERVGGPDPVLCRWGLHASVRALDALKHAPGPWCRIVEIGGTVKVGDDKVVGTERKILASFDAEPVLLEFASRLIDRAEETMPPSSRYPYGRSAIAQAREYVAAGLSWGSAWAVACLLSRAVPWHGGAAPEYDRAEQNALLEEMLDEAAGSPRLTNP